MRILFTGGGTGGHFFPIIAIARELKRIAEDERILGLELYYVGPDDFGREMLNREDILSETLPTGKLRRYFSFLNLVDLAKTFRAVLAAFWKLFRLMPDVVFSKGGFGAFPLLLVSRIYRIPVMIHESDAAPGLVNRWSAKFAKRTGVAFAKAAAYFPPEKTAVVGNPIRKRILGGIRDEAKDRFAIFSQKPVVLVLCGSQGSLAINQMILSGLKEFVNDFEIIHQTGKDNFADISAESTVILSSETKAYYHPYPFLDEMRLKEAYAACDIVIARSGSNIFEIAAVAKPSILIPLPHAAQDHQRQNAYEYAKVSGAVVIEQNNATPNLVRHTILRIFETPGELLRMQEGAARFARTDAAEIVAREILNLGLKLHG